MFKFDEICELIKLVGSSGVASVEIEHAGSRVRIEGVAPASPPAVAPAAPAGGGEAAAASASATPAPAAAAAEAPAAAHGDDEDDSLHWITSPIVGTFYRAPNPDADPYVKVGDSVEPGHTLCIVEAMKLMNEIESDVTGKIVRVLPQNAQPVEYGERLFGVRLA
jgi:acetyl-CoA carboxylase biotin carboxyl carrier protein